MRETQVLNLAECAELSRALQAPPRRFVHGLVWLLLGLLGTAVLWAGLTQVDLVVRAAGRVRPLDSPTKIFNPVRGEVLSVSTGGRVVEVNFREGDEVRKGDVLIRFDTARLDNEIAKMKRIIQASKDELAGLVLTKELLTRQFEAAQAKIEAELAQAKEEIRQAKEQQVADKRIAQTELDPAQDEVTRMERLRGTGAVSAADYSKATAKVREIKERLAKTQMPVDEGKPEIIRRGLAVAEKDQALKQQELEARHRLKQAEIEKALSELANLELEHSQADLRAPVDGIVTAGDVKVGDLLEPGKLVLEIAEQKGFRLEVLVPSEEVGHLQVGMPVRIKLDAYDFQKYGTLAGTVSYISADSGVPQGQQSAGGPADAIASKGQRAAVFVVQIDLAGDEVGRGELRGKVRLGMAGQAEIVTDHATVLMLLLKKIRQSISLG